MATSLRAAARKPVSTMLTSRRTVDLCRQRSCLCRDGSCLCRVA